MGRTDGLRCPFCGHGVAYVVDSRVPVDGGYIRRRRECTKCQRRYTTYEYVEDMMPKVIKRDGRQEPFDRAKLRTSILKACGKYSPARAASDELVAEIERLLLCSEAKEVTSQELGQLILYHLARLDPPSCARYGLGQQQITTAGELLAKLQELASSSGSTMRRPLAAVPGRTVR